MRAELEQPSCSDHSRARLRSSCDGPVRPRQGHVAVFVCLHLKLWRRFRLGPRVLFLSLLRPGGLLQSIARHATSSATNTVDRRLRFLICRSFIFQSTSNPERAQGHTPISSHKKEVYRDGVLNPVSSRHTASATACRLGLTK